MARIRSIKPEYWLDRKLAKGASRDARLLYIGLWNHADEHGRLHGDPAVIKGQVFPYDAVDILALLAELVAIGRVQSYDFDGDPYLFLPKLAKHQRLEASKSASRLPEPPPFDPCSSQAHSEKTVAESEPIAAESAPIVVQQVAGGKWQVASSREQVARSGGNPDSATESPQTLIAEWIDHCAIPPPSRVKGQLAKLIGELLGEGQPYDRVRQGLAEWHSKDQHPSTLPSFVFNATKSAPARAPNKATERTAAGLAVVRNLEAKSRGEIA